MLANILAPNEFLYLVFVMELWVYFVDAFDNN